MKKIIPERFSLNMVSPKRLSLRQLRIIFISLLAVFMSVSITACVWLYFQAEKKCENAAALNRAVIEASSIADTLKAADGSLSRTARYMHSHRSTVISSNTLTLYYDSDMQPSSQSASSYTAHINRMKENGCIIFEITISETPGKNQIYNLEFKIPQKKGGS